MAEFLTSAQMRAVEAQEIDSFRVSGLMLMERAGQGAVSALGRLWPDLAAAQALVLCGPGNNGGDGFVIARALQARGLRPVVFELATPRTPEAQAMRAAWAALGPVGAFGAQALATLRAQLNKARPLLVVDALFGIGLSRPLDTALTAPWAEFVASLPCPLWAVAVDVPSGVSDIDPDGARLAGFSGSADRSLTLTFHALKDAHRNMVARSEPIQIVDIGLPRHSLPRPLAAALSKSEGAHKFSYGHALILAGSVGRGGAARLAARAALRVGAGLVTLGCPPAAMIENAARLDAVMLRPLRDSKGLEALLQDARINALCLGPGLGLSAREEGLVATALASGRALVLDADALTLLARARHLRAGLHPGCVLTPHDGEFARLCPDLDGMDRARAVSTAAARLGCVVLLKGATTLIATPDGQMAVADATGDRAAPWLATAGSGDVLAGIITGLRARGLAALDAAQGGALLHQAAARAFGPGLIAEDLPDLIPKILREAGV
jgi:hydroxyethylthiazole kinase-like uncharacterized protein yjeF